MMPPRLPLWVAAVLLSATTAASAQTMPHAMHDHDMHGAAATPPARHLDAPAGASTLALPELGIEIVALHLSAANSLVDLRYRIIDPVLAQSLIQSSAAAVLVDPRTGAEGEVPMDEKVGSLRQNANRLRPGQVLAVLFGNPDRALKKGDSVVLRIGGWEIAGLAIQG